MKVLLDENMPHDLRFLITGHEVSTVRYLGWLGIRNGSLIAAAELEGFEVLLTGDKNMEYQQNMSDRKIAIVTLSSVNWPIIKHHAPAIQVAIDRCVPGAFVTVDCGVFRR